MKDCIGREIDYIRISVTDRCNYSCVYCMPSGGFKPLSHTEILSFEEILKIVEILTELGIKKIKITGGEPLVRKDIAVLIKMLNGIAGIEDITLTTNGYYLEEHIAALSEAGISTFNISIDSLETQKYISICKADGLEKVLRGIETGLTLGVRLKINTTLGEYISEKDILDIARYASRRGITARFIEMMPIGLGRINAFSGDMVLEILKKDYPDLQKTDLRGNGPAVYYRSGTALFGLITAVHHKFCDSCNRMRLSADGFLQPCLAYDIRTDIKSMLRGGADKETIKDRIYNTVYNKPKSHRFQDEGNFVATMNQIGG